MSAVYQRLRRTNRTREDRLSSSALNSSHLSLHSYLLNFHFFIIHPPLYILSMKCDVFYFLFYPPPLHTPPPLSLSFFHLLLLQTQSTSLIIITVLYSYESK